MAIPGFQDVMLPLLQLAGDQQEHSIREAYDWIAAEFDVNEAERRELLPSGRQPIIENRVGWARTYLSKAGLLESTRRAHFKVTERGLQVLAQAPPRIDVKFLRQFPEYLQFREDSEGSRPQPPVDEVDEPGETPQEMLDQGYQRMRRDLEQELLSQVKQCSPAFFERLVVDVLLGMGYGGSRKDAGEAIGRSGDDGIDGYINEDRLGLDVIYIQAKRWENKVGSGEIRNFVGGLVGRNTNKGVFITTSEFTHDAREFAGKVGHNIILIDGQMLAQLMIEHDVAVSTVDSYHVKRIDVDYFDED